jgi:hypothetical protein
VRLTILLSAWLVAGATSLPAAQGIRPRGPSTGAVRPVRPVRPLGPSGGPPLSPRGPVAGVPPSTVHRPVPIRSSFFGLVLFDPYWWWALGVADPLLVPPPAAPAPRPAGGLQLDVEPRGALVYVDGAFAGSVENFSGYYHHLETAAGLHWIELVAPNYEPLVATVTVVAGQTTTYRGWLSRAPGRD